MCTRMIFRWNQKPNMSKQKIKVHLEANGQSDLSCQLKAGVLSNFPNMPISIIFSVFSISKLKISPYI